MKITKSELKNLIKEEISRMQLNEYFYFPLYMVQEPIENMIKLIRENLPSNELEDGYLDDEKIKNLLMQMIEDELQKTK
jgi:hypothetical protein